MNTYFAQVRAAARRGLVMIAVGVLLLAAMALALFGPTIQSGGQAGIGVSRVMAGCLDGAPSPHPSVDCYPTPTPPGQ